MDQEPSPLQVNDLHDFPFNTFHDFQHALKNKKVCLAVDRSIALEWTRPRENARCAPASVRGKILLLSVLSYLTPLFFLVFVIIETSWLWLAAIPVYFVTFFIFQPSTEKVFFSGPLGQFVLFTVSSLLWFGLLWGVGFGISGLAALSLSLLIQQYAIRKVYSVAIESLIDAASVTEDLLCRMWRYGAVRIAPVR